MTTSLNASSAIYSLAEHSSVRRVNVLKGDGVEEDFVIAEEPLELLIMVEGTTSNIKKPTVNNYVVI